jgi:phosphoribosyl 1,2-cyclic phosphodiesterase
MMELTFTGTRGCIEGRSPRHSRHSALRITFGGHSLWIDCGLDWLDDVATLPADAILVTHAHPDHAFGLQQGASCPVYATAETWDGLRGFPTKLSRLILPARATWFCELKTEVHPVFHSLRAPAVALRLDNGRNAVFYAPDIAGLPDPAASLAGVDLYIGDGAAFDDSLLRLEEGTLCGHAPIEQQLDWCLAAGVPRVLFTHCGELIVAGNEKDWEEKVRALGARRNIEAGIAYDGLVMTLE